MKENEYEEYFKELNEISEAIDFMAEYLKCKMTEDENIKYNNLKNLKKARETIQDIAYGKDIMCRVPSGIEIPSDF